MNVRSHDLAASPFVSVGPLVELCEVCISSPEETKLVAATVVGDSSVLPADVETASVDLDAPVPSAIVVVPFAMTSGSSELHERSSATVIRPTTTWLILAALAACGEPGPGASSSTDTDDPPATQPTAAQGTGASSGEPDGPCGAGVCAQPPPDGWFGPLVKFEHDGDGSPPGCGGGWPDAAFTLLGGYTDPGPAVCGECSCTADLDQMCQLTGYRTEGSDVCEFDDFFSLPAPGACEPVAIDDGSLWVYAFTNGVTACSGESDVMIPEPGWAVEVTGCRGAELGESCDDEGRSCLPALPAGFEDNLCIFRSGDVDCPEGDYTERAVLYSGVEDTRACVGCQCEDVEAACSGTFETFDNADCSGAALSSAPDDAGCIGTAADVRGVRFEYDGPTACDVEQPTISIGSIAPMGAITYCCRP
jgi:hypothetical protein